ncbi:MAG: hypothetical protein ACQET7_10990 [Thermodesulfobacteriota bacterium]
MAKNKNHHLIKRGDTWYLKKRVNGRWIKKALSTSVTEARRKRDEHLRNLDLYGSIDPPEEPIVQEADPGPLFGEVAERWARIKTAQIKGSTMRDYRSSMP